VRELVTRMNSISRALLEDPADESGEWMGAGNAAEISTSPADLEA
jgi:hypothetical protein